MQVLKGHGTENDFVVVPDLDGTLELTDELVRRLCDRHAGIGADGVLRVVRSANDPDGKEYASEVEFFMDYRNADGSVAQMCGNGVRVFMRYLQRVGLAGTDAQIGTRGGVKSVRTMPKGALCVAMGQPRILGTQPLVTTGSQRQPTAGTAVEMPNPHVVVELGTPAELVALDLSAPPAVEPAGPQGQNVEFIVRSGPRHLVMRVHERGVGETRSCGTGICAAVVAIATADGVGADGRPWRVDVPGGTCTVSWGPDGVDLSGPAVIVAELELDEQWLSTLKGLADTCHDG